MAVRKMQIDAWEQAVDAEDPTLPNLSRGPSPGGAAAELGISRQAVHKAIRSGQLDALAVYKGRKLLFFNIGLDSIARYKELRKNRLLEQLKRAL